MENIMNKTKATFSARKPGNAKINYYGVKNAWS
jgi:hypothetical protein